FPLATDRSFSCIDDHLRRRVSTCGACRLFGEAADDRRLLVAPGVRRGLQDGGAHRRRQPLRGARGAASGGGRVRARGGEARGAVKAARSLEDALAEAAVAVVAVPVADLAAAVRDALASAPAACTVTDVGSTKETVCAAAAGDARFVGGHPICGAETRGPERA